MIGATVTPTTSSTSSPLHLHSANYPPVYRPSSPLCLNHPASSTKGTRTSTSTSLSPLQVHTSTHSAIHRPSSPPSRESVASTCSTSVSAHLHRVRLYFQNHDYYSTYSTSPPSPLPLPPPSPPPAMSFRPPPPPPPPLLHPVTHLPPVFLLFHFTCASLHLLHLSSSLRTTPMYTLSIYEGHALTEA